MISVKFSRVEDGMVQYECIDKDGKVYGVADTIQEGMIMETLVIDMDTYDEVEDSELFKRIVTARALYLADSYEVLEAMKELY
jgi:N-acetylglutamate synthase-like GNAT family acetyltransferase